MASTEKPIFSNLHGNGIEGSSNYPIINANFKITCTRTPGSSTVSWQVSNNTWSGTNSGNGHYAFQFWAAITLSANNATPPVPSGSSNYILEKTSTSWTTSWWNQFTLYNPSGTFTCTDNTAKLHIWVWSDCYNYNSDHYCYSPHNNWVKIESQSISLPDYGYAVTYNTDGGFPTIPSQTKQVGVALTLSSTVPASQFQVRYYNNTSEPDQASDIKNINKTFNNWKCSADNNTYAPGSTYSLDQSCTMTAQWSNNYTPIAIPDKTYTVSFNSNGGSAVSNRTLVRDEVGYGNSASATTAICQPGVPTVASSDEVRLWPIYGDATLAYNSLPTPTKSGYTLDGWYTDAGLTNKVTSNLTVTGNITLYAKWTFSTIHKYSNGWDTSANYTWRYVDGAWHQIGHIYRYDASQSKWIDLIPAPQPADVYTYGSGLNSYYYFGMVEYHSENAAEWQVTNSGIFRGHQGNSILTFGGVCDRGDFNYVCIECKTQDGNENANGVATEYNVLQLGYRWVRNGKGSHFNDWPNHSNFITHWGKAPGNIPETQVFKFDLHEIIAEPFYLELHACDIVPTIYNIWFE